MRLQLARLATSIEASRPVRASGPSRYFKLTVAAEVRFEISEHAKHIEEAWPRCSYRSAVPSHLSDAPRAFAWRMISCRSPMLRGRRFCGPHQRVTFPQEIEHGAQFLTAFLGSAAALLGPDHVAAPGSQGGLLNGKVLVDRATPRSRLSSYPAPNCIV